MSKNWSQEQVADFLHISQSTYARIERGDGSSWANYIRKICELYKITAVDIFEEDDERIEKKPQEIEEKLGDSIKDLKKIVKSLKKKNDNK
ncbi:helix-turn-helix domain-containing protein [Flavobacterium ustbae]|uniref:helix-turn-helix domain-containing protein n=1 Tax=Flavobacterium ustbae TaxID=2488790 RepID=UPI001F28D319